MEPLKAVVLHSSSGLRRWSDQTSRLGLVWPLWFDWNGSVIGLKRACFFKGFNGVKETQNLMQFSTSIALKPVTMVMFAGFMIFKQDFHAGWRKLMSGLGSKIGDIA